MRSCLLVLLGALLSACGSTSLTRQANTGVSPTLNPNGSMYVAVCSPGYYGEKNYTNSGRMTADAVSKAFSEHLSKAESGTSVQDRSAAMQSARSGKFSYLVVPKILHWEDRATEWSGRRDRIEVEFVLMEVPGGKVLDAVTLTGKSKWLTLGGDHPQDMLGGPLRRWARSMF